MMKAQVMPMRALDILLVEDDDSDACLVQNALESLGAGEFGVVRVCSLEEALPALAVQRFDIALLDLSLPGSSRLEALQCLHHGQPQLPVVILTGLDDEKLALAALQDGAQDYLVKEQADGSQIRRSIRYAIERKHFEDNLIVQANFDPLTGLANRSLFTSRLEMALARARRSGETVAVFFIDLNQFKDINDKLGHEAGDQLLKGVGARLTQCLRECDTVARFGGDEYAVLIEGAAEPRSCAIVARKMIDTIAAPFPLDGGEACVGLSIGITLSLPDSRAEALLKQADSAMYRAKAEGRSNYQFYTEHMQKETIERLQLEQELAQAIRDKSPLLLYYQPKLDLTSGKLAGVEALIRWNHPQRGLLLPAEFLPLMAPSLAAELDQFVVETVCRDLRSWQTAGMAPVQVSIHISPRRWENAHSIDGLLSALAGAGMEMRQLAVEVEESAILHHGESGFDILSRVRDTGVALHLDNFGADVSSLKLLARCPLDAVKIDRGLTGSLTAQGPHSTLVEALIALGHQLGLKVVAEGVETPQQQARLAALACDQIQGLVLSKPLPATDFSAWMGAHAQW